LHLRLVLVPVLPRALPTRILRLRTPELAIEPRKLAPTRDELRVRPRLCNAPAVKRVYIVALREEVQRVRDEQYGLALRDEPLDRAVEERLADVGVDCGSPSMVRDLII
jgi:hypothetical protein